MDFPCGPSRNPASAATSSGSTSAPSGGITGGVADRPGSASIGVFVGPGDRTLTVMARGASSCAQDRPMPSSAALVAAYWLLPGNPVEVLLPISRTRPPSGMRGTTAFARASAAATCTANMPARASASSSPRTAVRWNPAACTSAWAGRTSATTAASEPGLERSAGSQSKPGPRSASRRLSLVTFQPSSSSLVAMACPMPELQPVTTAWRSAAIGGTLPFAGGRGGSVICPQRRNPHVLDRLPEVGVGDVERAVRALVNRGVRVLAVQAVAGVVGQAVTVPDVEVPADGPGAAGVLRDGQGHGRARRPPEGAPLAVVLFSTRSSNTRSRNRLGELALFGGEAVVVDLVIERKAPLGVRPGAAVVVDQRQAPVGERRELNGGVVVGQLGGDGFAPGGAVVGGAGLVDGVRPAAAEQGQQ